MELPPREHARPIDNGWRRGAPNFTTDDDRLFYTVSSDETDVWTMNLEPRNYMDDAMSRSNL